MPQQRDNFPSKTVDILKQRGAFICSNPNCRKITVGPAEASENQVVYIGRAAHICAAAEGGPRYDPNMSVEQRSDIANAIFLCANCADAIDDNSGIDYSVDLLKSWKRQHEEWVRNNLNKSLSSNAPTSVIHVKSHNQIGGITAGIVNMVPPGRHFNDVWKAESDKNFPDTNEKVSILSVTGDAEAYNFAEEIRHYMNSKGFKISEIGQFQMAPVVKGVRIQGKVGARTILVGYKS